MRKTLKCAATILLLSAWVSSCRQVQPIPIATMSGSTAIVLETIPPSTVPPGVDGGDIREFDLETLEAIRQINQESPGLSIGIRGTYAERVPGTYDAFRVEENEPFIGRFDLWNGLPQNHEFVVTCLVDHVQAPCTPDASLVQMVMLDADQTLQLPLEIPGLANGLHDFSVTFWQDPYADHDDPQADSRVFNSETYRVRVSLFVGGETKHPSLLFQEPFLDLPAHDFTWLVVSQEMNPRDEYGGISVVTHLSASAGELFDFYIHLNNREEVDIDMATTAFINYEQVPLHWKGEAYTPLYTRVRPVTWQPMAVQICAPDEPGHYEFIVVGTLFPFARLDVETEETYGVGFLINNAFSSVRILLEVE